MEAQVDDLEQGSSAFQRTRLFDVEQSSSFKRVLWCINNDPNKRKPLNLYAFNPFRAAFH